MEQNLPELNETIFNLLDIEDLYEMCKTNRQFLSFCNKNLTLKNKIDHYRNALNKTSRIMAILNKRSRAELFTRNLTLDLIYSTYPSLLVFSIVITTNNQNTYQIFFITKSQKYTFFTKRDELESLLIKLYYNNYISLD